MGSDSLALLLLAGALLVALVGLWDVLAGLARRDHLRERAMGAPPANPVTRVLAAIDRRFARTRYGYRLSIRLLAAAVDRTPLQFVLIAIALGVGTFAVCSLVFSTVICVAAALIVVRVAFGWLDRKREQRKEAFVAQLPELARLLSNGTSAGLGVNAALEIAVQELEDPARSELRLVREEVRIGSSFDAALAHLGERMPSRELGVLVSTLVVQQRSGGDLVRALADMSQTLEARKKTLREVKTLMSGAVATAYMVGALGIGSVFLIDLVKPGSLDNLTGSPIGLIVVAVSSILYVIAFVIIKRITRVET